ncbi:aldehyde dehydrogenase (NADP(+)) [Aureibacter tunicatorum]|uniref:NADP-dependent aldehyde dehydrogenase n=1 Tax=Aureibacter tunicatorum TaxID=866807 RepID=A0AAE4BPC4_9BACT|nr:aldehyde dehydrogenase (NADP(+)) [Aureibacter tunicatorum]MDR6237819.1 NADP-dependent aldehyde dehydrogenase [Aureibacter tunicatorum]BDD02854.1 2,5-dioxovalerate dehydrogenase [Aureibacter tunicatorum]
METLEKGKYTLENPSAEELNGLLELSNQAFATFRKLSGARKAEFLDAIADEIVALGDDLVQAACEESGLPEGRIVGERGRTTGQLKLFASLVREGSWLEATVDTAIPDRQPVPKPDIRKMLVGLGPVAVFGASNFPLAFSTAGGDTASALAAGCPVIVKAHEGHPRTSDLVATAIYRAAEKTEMPEGVFTMVHGSGVVVGQALVKHPIVKAVGFTGSTYAGRALYDAAAQREVPIPVFAEMGSINPVLLMPEALDNKAEALGQLYAGSITLGVGQFCTNPGLLLAKKGASLDTFVSALSTAIEATAPAKMLNDRVHGGYTKSLEEALAQKGIEVIARSSAEANAENIEGRPTIATVEAETFLNNPKLHEEVFGPYSLIVQYDSEEELDAIVETLEGQLTVTIMAEDSEIANYSNVIDKLENITGRIIFNGVPTGVEVCPSMQHGGPYPAASDSRFTSVGTGAIRRFVRPLAFQNWPQALLPEELRDDNSLNIWRTVNGELTKDSL